MNSSKIKTLKVAVRSSLIEYLEYDCPKYLLKVRFKRGKSRHRTHVHQEITPDHFQKIIDSQSIGRAVLRLVDTSGKYQ
ncbi:MAG: hypothetical protein ABJG78_03330 [Cyclobacteriaceae bacterium]